MMQETLIQLVTILGGTAMGVALLGYLSRKLLEHLMSKDVEKFKAELKATQDIEMERLRSDLKMQAFEHETRFRKLHENVARTIAETYPLLRRVFDSVSSLVSPIEMEGEPDKEEKMKIASDANRAFTEYFLSNRIYYPKKLYDKINDFHLLLVDNGRKFNRAYDRGKAGGEPATEHWYEAFAGIRDKARPLFDDMHDDFQSILGFKGK